MPNVILVKDGRIRFPTNLESSSAEAVFMALEDWITPKGLLIPLGRGALEMREHLIDPTYMADVNYEDTVMGALIRTDGRLVMTEFVREQRNRDRVRPIFMVRPMGPKAVWALCNSGKSRQAALMMLNFYEDLSDVLDRLNYIEPLLLNGYEEWDYAALVKHVQAEVKRQYPDNPGTVAGGGIPASGEGGDAE